MNTSISSNIPALLLGIRANRKKRLKDKINPEAKNSLNKKLT